MKKEAVRKYVKVVASFSPDGDMLPLCVVWEDGRRFDVDQVKNCVFVANRRTGGKERHYTCTIGGREASIYYEEYHRWFVEANALGGK